MATFTAMVRTGDKHLRKDGTRSVYIRLAHKGAVRYLPTNFYVAKKQLTPALKIKDVSVRNACDELIVEYRRRVARLHLEVNDYLLLHKTDTAAWAIAVIAVAYF